jgi:hypothetical protein
MQVAKGDAAALALTEAEIARDRAVAEAEESRRAAAALEERLSAEVRRVETLSKEADALRASTDREEQAALQELRQLLTRAEGAEAAAREQAKAADWQLAQKQDALSTAEAQVCAAHVYFCERQNSQISESFLRRSNEACIKLEKCG